MRMELIHIYLIEKKQKKTIFLKYHTISSV